LGLWRYGDSISRRFLNEFILFNIAPQPEAYLLQNFKNLCIIVYIMSFTWEGVIGLIVGISTIISAAALGIRWLVKHYFQEIKHELKPNGGSSLKDQANRLEKDIVDLKQQNAKGEEYHERLDVKIDNLTNMFVEYVSRQK